jgi:threonine/homoserine/homoserine lactone efflux protein
VLSSTQVWQFALAAWVLVVIPGPSVLFTVSRGVALGRRAAVTTVLGNSTGVLTHVVAVAAGVGAIVAGSVAVFNVLKLLGAAYLVYLGVRAVRHRRDVLGALAPATTKSHLRLWLDGYIVGVTNPKTTLFFLAVLPQFVDPHGGSTSMQLLLLGLIAVVVATISDSMYGIAAGSVRTWLDRSPRKAAALGGAGGVAMIGLGVRLAFTGRHD